MRAVPRASLIALFHRQQALLAFHAPAVTTCRTVFADHTMTGNRQCHRIGCAGASYGAHGCGTADGGSYLCVRLCLAAGNSPQVFPDQTLECGGPDVERQLDL